MKETKATAKTDGCFQTFCGVLELLCEVRSGVKYFREIHL